MVNLLFNKYSQCLAFSGEDFMKFICIAALLASVQSAQIDQKSCTVKNDLVGLQATIAYHCKSDALRKEPVILYPKETQVICPQDNCSESSVTGSIAGYPRLQWDGSTISDNDTCLSIGKKDQVPYNTGTMKIAGKSCN